MLKIETVATTWYTYELNEDEENKIRNMIKENKDGKFDYCSEEESIIKAFEMLYGDGETQLYQDDNTVESDFNTDEFKFSEFNECNAEEWLSGVEA